MIQQIMPFSVAIKMLLVAFITALGGSGYIGFLSEYATYFYAWNNHFRLPAEGSPYLKIIISSITFILIVLSSLIFMISYILLEVFKKFNENIIKYQLEVTSRITDGVTLDKSVKDKVISLLSKSINIKTHYVIFIFGAILFFILLIFASFDGNIKATLSKKITISAIASVSYIIILLPFAFPKFTIPISLLFAGIFLIASPFALFNQKFYSSILEEIKYGGGFSTELTQGTDVKKYKILLRTTDSLFVKGDDEVTIEIPLSQIDVMSYLPR